MRRQGEADSAASQLYKGALLTTIEEGKLIEKRHMKWREGPQIHSKWWKVGGCVNCIRSGRRQTWGCFSQVDTTRGQRRQNGVSHVNAD